MENDKIETIPVKIEGYQLKTLMFTVEAFDDCFATVGINTLVNVAGWDEISEEIRKALVSLNLEGQSEQTLSSLRPSRAPQKTTRIRS